MMDRTASAGFRSVNCDRRYGIALLTILVALTLVGLGGESVRTALQYQRESIAAGQWWRLLGAHIVHLGGQHLAFNLAGLALLWMLFARSFAPRRWWLVVLAAMLAVDAGLWRIDPAVHWYVGASGALHGVWAAGALSAARERDAGGHLQWRNGAPLIVLCLKLIYEQWGGQSAFLGALPVVLNAHLYGAAGGAVAALAIIARFGRRA
jgi:rhomboid family GlyGly-CTERM serine protease